MSRISSGSSAICAGRIDVASPLEDRLDWVVRQVGSIILGKERALSLIHI